MNKKIKIIDLLCLISIGEEVPKKIKHCDNVYRKCDIGDDYFNDASYDWLFRDVFDTSMLNDEVKILDDKEDNPKTLKFGDEIILTRTNCDDIQGFIISAKGIEPIEDKDIPLIPDDELIILKQKKAIDMQKAIDFNFKVLKEKINQILEVINNEYNK